MEKDPFRESLEREINAMEQSIKSIKNRIARIKMLYQIDKLKGAI